MMNNQLTLQESDSSMEKLLQLDFIRGIYRLAGCLLMLDKKQQPYWKLLFSDVHGTVTMYMFEQPSCLDKLAHGVFVDVEAQVKTHGKYHYANVTKLEAIDLSSLNEQTALNFMPSYNAPNPSNLIRLKKVIEKIDSRILLFFSRGISAD